MTAGADDVLTAFSSLRQHQRNGQRSPHKPLLALLALGRLADTGSSDVPWSVAEEKLADLIAEFGPASNTGRAQSAAYPFTRLRADHIWTLDADVDDDKVSPLRAGVTGRFEASLEQRLRDEPALIETVARSLVDSHFPPTVAGDVLVAVGFDPEVPPIEVSAAGVRKRSQAWRNAVLEAWDEQCAFCGFDGRSGGMAIGVEAAHIRWFALDGPDDLDTAWRSAHCTTSCSTVALSAWTTRSPSSCRSASPHVHPPDGLSTSCTDVRSTRVPGRSHLRHHT